MPKGFVNFPERWSRYFVRTWGSGGLGAGQGGGMAQMELCAIEKTGRYRHSTALCSDLLPGLSIQSQALGKAAEANVTKGAD